MTTKTVVLQGELLKQGKDSSSYKLRWLELLRDGSLNWLDKEGAAPNGSVSALDHCAMIDADTPAATAKDETRFGFRLVPKAPNGRTLALQAASHEERQLWMLMIERVAYPDVQRFDGGLGRVIKIRKPMAPARLGLELQYFPGLPGVEGLERRAERDVDTETVSL